jgi:hypothetical protein
MRFSRSVRAAVAIAIAVVLGAVSPAAAYASGFDDGETDGDPSVTVQPDPDSQYIEMTLTRIGVDHDIAEAAGYDVRVDDQGVEYAAPKGQASQFNTVPGTCGTSFVYFTAVDTKKHYTSIYTGYTIRDDWSGAIYTNWDVSVLDNYGVSHKTWRDPSKATHFWAKKKGFTASGRTKAYADVTQGSIATLSDGTICFSHGPSASAQL